MLATIGTMEKKPQYWFNTKTGEVEQGHQSLAIYRIGPFETPDEAKQALEILADRSKKLREQEELDD